MIWRHKAPWLEDAPLFDELFSSASFQYVLYGMGFVTKENSPALRGEEYASAKANKLFGDNLGKTNQLLSSQPRNRELLTKIKEHGLQKI